MTGLLRKGLELIGLHYRGDKVILQHRQEGVERILAANQKDRARSDANWAADGDIKRIARLPMAVYEQARRMGILEPGNEGEFVKFLERNPQLKSTEKRLA
jgi:hypothetical protein